MLPEIERHQREKMQKMEEIKKLKSKILIEKQINIELKRKIEENESYYQDQVHSWEDSVLVKDEYITQLLKKLKQIDIFIKQKNKGKKNGFEKFKGFRISSFIKDNTELFRKKVDIYLKIYDVRSNIEDLKQENYLFKEEMQQNLQEKDKEKNENIKKIIDYYKKNCRVLHMRMKLMKSCLNNMSKTIRLLNVPNELKQSLADKEEEMKALSSRRAFEDRGGKVQDSITLMRDKTATLNDFTQKLENFMDFSILIKELGAKEGDNNKTINESKYKDLGMKNISFANVTCDWELSRISKKNL